MRHFPDSRILTRVCRVWWAGRLAGRHGGWAMLLCLSFCLAAAPATAAPPSAPSATTAVGDQVTNPTTGQLETVLANEDGAVLLESGTAIIYRLAVGDTLLVDDETFTVYGFEEQNGVAATAKLERRYAVQVAKTDDDGNVVTDEDGNTLFVTEQRRETKTEILVSTTDVGAPAAPVPAQSPAVATAGRIDEVARAAGGGNGRDGGGFRVCVPLLGCANFGVTARDGGNGSQGGAPARTVIAADHGAISVAGSGNTGKAGIRVGSQGGRGGNGGSSAGITGAGGDGGIGGNGGRATAVNEGSIQTSGDALLCMPPRKRIMRVSQ